MNSHVTAISNRLRLRPPQRESLEILARICEILPLEKHADTAAALQAVKTEFPTVTDFERDFPSLCFALATGVGKSRLMEAFIAFPNLRTLALKRLWRSTGALSRLNIRIDWQQRLQMQEAAAKTGSVDPLSRCDAADGAFAANPAGRGPGGRELWRSSSMYVPIHFPPHFAPTTPWPSVNPNIWV